MRIPVYKYQYCSLCMLYIVEEMYPFRILSEALPAQFLKIAIIFEFEFAIYSSIPAVQEK